MVASQVKFITTLLTWKPAPTHAFPRPDVCLPMHMCMHTHICAHTCTHMRAHTRPCTHMREHRQMGGQTGPHQKPLSGGRVQGKAVGEVAWLPWWSAVPSGAGDRFRN